MALAAEYENISARCILSNNDALQHDDENVTRVQQHLFLGARSGVCCLLAAKLTSQNGCQNFPWQR